MYDRRIDGKETSFGVSGTLFRDALVFYDRETGSHWSQINGKAIRGDLEGKALEEIPSMVTTWGEWKKLHPNTLVLRPSEGSRDGTRYANYVTDEDMLGVLGTSNPDPRLPGKTMVLGILTPSGQSAAIPIDKLSESSIMQGKLDETPYLALMLTRSGAAAYDRRIDGKVRDFKRRPDGKLVDDETGSVWEPEQGEAIEGPLKGQSLRRLDSLAVFWFVWANFHPETKLYPEE